MAPGRDHSYEFGPFVLNAAEHVLTCRDERIPLTPKVFAILLTLVENAGHIVSKSTLFEHVWPDTIPQEDNLTFNISELRKSLRKYSDGQTFIKTEPKRGYRFIAPVKVILPHGFTAAGNLPAEPQASGSGHTSASANGRETVWEEGISLQRLLIWGGLGLALLVVAATTMRLATPPPVPKILKYDQLTADGREKLGGVVTDGERVYFTEQTSKGWIIAQVSASGGEPAPVASTPKDSILADISADHRNLLVVEDRDFGLGTLMEVPLPDGEPRRLGNLQAYSAAWSPDEKSLAYTAGTSLFICDAEGRNPRRIVTLSGQLDCVHWASGGGQLCFTQSKPSGYSLWKSDSDGKSLACLYPEGDSGPGGSHGYWAPNGKYLVAESNCAGHSMPAAALVPSGPFNLRWGQFTCLGFGPLDLVAYAFSPDSAQLFGLGYSVKQPQMEEFDAREQEFEPYLPSFPAEYADFSADGHHIAYITGEKELTGAMNLWIGNVDGNHRVQITKPPLLAMSPRWSPDGKWVAFMGKDPGQAWRVRLVSAEGGSYEPVTPVNDEEGAPTWSPGSDQIAFGGMLKPTERTAGGLAIHILNLQTRQVSQVLMSEGLWTARWSPDGRYIAALTEDSRNVMLFDFHTKQWTKLATFDKIPDLVWSRRRETLYFNGEVAATGRSIYRLRVPGGKLERIASLIGRTDRDWLGLTPDDSPLIVRSFGAKEVYSLAVNWP
jgi:DNA-binding winged helix-turn-helix (wHTH) protein/Tol biopolymer transport system component